MKKEWGSTTPHQILKRFDRVIEKPRPDERIIATTLDNLPIKDRLSLELVGYGDWVRGRSSEGSGVFSTSKNSVLKIPLGVQNSQTLEPIVRAREIMATIGKFSNISPETGCFIARVDEDEPPKVVIFQEKVEGKPACETTINKLLKPKVASQFLEVVDTKIDVLQND